jgi:hypothetical protein
MKREIRGILFFLLTILFIPIPASTVAQDTIGVIFVAHGGMDKDTDQGLWDASLQQFSYDPNHSVYKFVIWNPANWGLVLQMGYAPRFLRKYEFSYERIGGTDPFRTITEEQIATMKENLDKLGKKYGITFEVDWAYWMNGDDMSHYPYPRFMYNGTPGNTNKCTYCGEQEPDGPWPDCDPERYNVDGPAERLLKKGVSRIIMIDITVGGVRFYKSFDVVEMTKRVLSDYGSTVPVLWVNDYSNLMERSYPTAPLGWTSSLKAPTTDQHVLLNGSPNPIAVDQKLAAMHVDGIEASMSHTVSAAKTGVVLFNHALADYDEYYDPKINDTLIVNKNIKAMLLERHPLMDPDNIIGAYGGIKELNVENNIVELTRDMRGETLGYAWLYESDKEMPDDKWGYRYWDALEYLKNRGVKHIVIGFPQIVTDSVLNLVEINNQIGKEIGVKTWFLYGTWDYVNFPEVGHPFADYWGNWADTDCGGVECCFVMGGCDDGRPYPPERQTSIDEAISDLDPYLVYDLSDYGHLGYDQDLGAPDANAPVQDQYTGTWALWIPPNNDPRMGRLLAKHIINAAVKPMVYITNGEVEGIEVGESVTWVANVTGGEPGYTCQWYLQKEGRRVWLPVGENSSTWTWTPKERDPGTYAIRCKVTDTKHRSGEVTWEGFTVSTGNVDKR